MHMRAVTMIAASLVGAVLSAPLAVASTATTFPGGPQPCSGDLARVSPWSVTFPIGPGAPAAGPIRFADSDSQAAPVRRPVPVEYSDGYKTRAKIHKIASFATLPLFVANYVVGQDLYNHPGESDSKKGLHGGLAATTGVLFGINTVTGAWNLWEGRKDTNHRGIRMTHGILMMAADVGFLATGLLVPDSEGPYTDYTSRRSTHRTVALTSMAIATVGYVIMLFGGH
jgi:hypothetical protein